MTPFIRYFILIASVFFSLGSYAVDHIICNISSLGIPAQSIAGNTYTNTYTCTNSYPASFPAIQLLAKAEGNATGTIVSGTCATTPLASGKSCQFNLSFKPQASGTITFNLRISIGTLYYRDMPTVTTIVKAINSTISWPGSTMGIASVGTDGNGNGSFVANAVDSSGHLITYTFALSGQGTVVGDQKGTFALSGINPANPGTLTITATADDAAEVVGAPITITANGDTIPTKIISIYNNSTEAIYPIIETPIQPRDFWMQAQFKVLTPNVGQFFPTTKQYRVYVNPTTGGIPPNGSVTISVPFYTALVPTPGNGTAADEYADWWNAIRVYLYDEQVNLLVHGYTPDSAHPMTAYSRSLVCLTGSTACTPGTPFTIYAGVTGLPLADPNQLTEYTFADVVTSTTIPYPIDRTHVDYDISSVDQVYLPVAMEPFGNNQVGYNGSIMDLNSFRTRLQNFVTTANWPTYLGNPPYANPRVPGAYNVLINADLTNSAPTITALTNNWNTCSVVPGSDCAVVKALFDANLVKYNTVCPTSPAPTPAEFLQHVYGWVSFNCAGQLNALNESVPQADYNLAISSYHTLQYNGVFNPYVGLIHDATYLDTSMYAYSIDDAVGNMNELGNGIVIAIAGVNGLPNPHRYDKSKIINVLPGNWPDSSPNPVFDSYGICSQTPSTGTLPRGSGFRIGTVDYPCTITLQDTADRVFQFTIKVAPPYDNTKPPSTYIQCAAGDTWCAGVNIESVLNAENQLVNNAPTPPPPPL